MYKVEWKYDKENIISGHSQIIIPGLIKKSHEADWPKENSLFMPQKMGECRFSDEKKH